MSDTHRGFFRNTNSAQAENLMSHVSNLESEIKMIFAKSNALKFPRNRNH